MRFILRGVAISRAAGSVRNAVHSGSAGPCADRFAEVNLFEGAARASSLPTGQRFSMQGVFICRTFWFGHTHEEGLRASPGQEDTTCNSPDRSTS